MALRSGHRLVPDACQLTSYDAATGRKLWWIRGMSWQPKSTPVIDVEMIYAHWWENGGEAEQPTEAPTFSNGLCARSVARDGG